jgi:hypothetical protein
MGILRINQLPSGTSLTEDDLLIILDDPSGIAVTKQIPSSRIRDLIYDENGKLTNAQLPDTIQARLCVLNDTDAVLSQQLLFSGELAAPTDRSYLRKGNGTTIGGQIIANGNSYIENNINQPIVSLQTLAGSGAYFTDSFNVTPSQKNYFQVGNSGNYLSYETELQAALNKIRENSRKYLVLDGIGTANLKNYSPKYAAIIDRINKMPGSSLVYSQFNTAEGLGLLGYALEANDYTEITELISLVAAVSRWFISAFKVSRDARSVVKTLLRSVTASLRTIISSSISSSAN